MVRSPSLNASRCRYLGRRRGVAVLHLRRDQRDLAGQRVQPALAHALLRALEGREEPLVGKRLQDVVHRVHVERRRRIPAERRDEDDDRSVRRGAPGDLQARGLGHLDVEERDVDVLAGQGFAGSPAVGAVGDHLDFGVAAEQAHDHRPGVRLVFGDEHAEADHAAPAAGRISSTIVPAGAFGRTTSAAALPYRRSMRDRVLRRPVPASRDGVEARRQTDAVVGDPQPKLGAVPAGRADLEPTRRGLRGEAVPQRVLDERLQQQRRHLEPAAGVVDVVRDLQPIAEPRALQIDVALDDAQLVAERRQSARPAARASSASGRSARAASSGADVLLLARICAAIAFSVLNRKCG